MALTGTYRRNLDEKLRVAVPKRLRDQFGEPDLKTLYVAPETDGSLGLYSPAAFQALAERLGERSNNRTQIRNYLRLFYSRAEQVDLDSQGRIRIPDRLAEFAQLKHDIVLLGVHDHVELWDQAVWDEFLTRHGPAFDEMAHRAFEAE
jgi:MraZ protein